MAERRSPKPQVGGSIPSWPAILSGDGFFIHEKTGKICLILVDEFYDIENKDTETIVKNFGLFVKKQKEEYNVPDAYSDSAEQLIKRSFNNLGVVRVHDSKKNPIVDRIRFIDSLMGQGRFYIMERCKHTIDALHGAVWDDKAEKETRLDDGTSNIDSLDAMEYGCEMRMKDFR